MPKRAQLVKGATSIGSARPTRFALDAANLDFVVGVEALAAKAFCPYMLGVSSPRLVRGLGLELDDRHALAVIRGEGLVREITRHSHGEIAHPRDPDQVF